MPDKHIDQLKEQLIAETEGKKEYAHVKSTDEIAMEKALEQFREMRKTETKK